MPIFRRHRTARRDCNDRRAFLVASGLGFAGLTVGQPHQAAPADMPAAGRATARSTILIWLNGGPSHIDLWDMKPDAPREIGGDFRPISTAAPGISLCEHLPQLAQQAQHLAL